MSTISMRNFSAGATTSPISVRIPSSATRRSRRSSREEQPRLLPLPAHPFETDLMRPVVVRQTGVRPLRSQQLLDSPYPRPPAAHAAGQRHHRPHRRGRRRDRAACAQLRQRRRRSRTRRISTGLLTATHQANASSTRDRLRLAVPITATLFDAPGRARRRAPAASDPVARAPRRLWARRNSPPPSRSRSSVTPWAPAPSPTSSKPGAATAAQPPPVPMILPDRPGVRDLDITPHRLESYDDLSRPDADDDPDR